MQHHLKGIARCVLLVALAPVVADGIGENVARLAERRSRNAAPNFGISLETVLGVLVPEVKCAIRSGSAESSVDRMERDVIHGVARGAAVHDRVSMALE